MAPGLVRPQGRSVGSAHGEDEGSALAGHLQRGLVERPKAVGGLEAGRVVSGQEQGVHVVSIDAELLVDWDQETGRRCSVSQHGHQ